MEWPRPASFGVAVACGLWVWVALHAVAAFGVTLREERELRAEARVLLAGPCDLPRSFPMSGTLIRCDEARAVAGRWAVAAATERAVADVLRAVADGARREVSDTLRAVGLVGGVVVGVLTMVRVAAARASLAHRLHIEHNVGSDMWRAKGTTIIPLDKFHSM